MMIVGQIPMSGGLFALDSKQSPRRMADHPVAITLNDALNRPMDIRVMVRVIREHIIPFKVDQFEHQTLWVNESTIKDVIAHYWHNMQSNESEDSLMVYLQTASPIAPIFTYAVILVLLGCFSSRAVCVVVDGQELCHHIFTIRSLTRELIEGCTTLSILQFVAILRELALQLKSS
jgi:hypothetical protein